MGILPFRRSNTPPPIYGSDWSQQDMANFYRAHRLLSQNGVAIGIDRGQSDSGDPWLVFYDAGSEDVFLHIARFDGACILACETLGLNIKRASLDVLMSCLEDEIRRFVDLRHARQSNVVLHPASRMILSLSALFLLFKLETDGNARAAAPDSSLIEAARKTDATTPSRLPAALTRLLEITDAPAAVAALAGTILSIELARLQLSEDQADTDPQLASHTTLEMASIEEANAETATAATAPGAENAIPLAVVSQEPAVLIALPTELSMSSGALLLEEMTARQTAAIPDTFVSALPANDAVVTDSQTPSLAPVPAAQLGETPKVVAATAADPLKSGDSLATAALSTVLAISLLDPLDAQPQPADTFPIASAQPLGEVTITDLANLDAQVGAFHETALTGSALTDRLVAFMQRAGSYEVEMANGQVLIEQYDTPTLSTDLVGLWTNVMTDGSAISVIGHTALVSEITQGLA